jgi:hypothetical protein
MAHTSAGYLVLPKPAGQPQQILVCSNIFRSASAAKKDAGVPFRTDLAKGHIDHNRVTLPLLGDGSTWFDFVQNHLVAAVFRSGHDGKVAALA